MPPAVVVGGVAATLAQVEQAAEALEAWGSTTIRPVLAPLGNPLAGCDYRAVAAPYKREFASRPGCRGASGAPATKLAFVRALRQILADARSDPASGYAVFVAEALEAFASDESYAAEMARSAVAAGRSAHAAVLRAELRAAAHRAVSRCDVDKGVFSCAARSACGTGDCRYAEGRLAALQAPAVPGKSRRGASHASAEGWDMGAAVSAMETAFPYVVAVRVAGNDAVNGVDEVPV